MIWSWIPQNWSLIWQLTWENAKVNTEDISSDKPAPGAKRPARTLPPKK